MTRAMPPPLCCCCCAPRKLRRLVLPSLSKREGDFRLTDSTWCRSATTTSSGTPPEEPPSRESPEPSRALKKRSRRSELAAPASARQPKPTPIGNSRRSSRLSHAETPTVASPGRNAEPPAPETRRTRSQPIVGKLQDVLSAPETLAAIGGYDWAKGKCEVSFFSCHE